MSQNQLALTNTNQSIDKLIFDEYKLATIREQICKGGTPAEIEIFVATCEQRGLNPFAKQIYFMKYGNSPAAHVASIDGLRLIADRTGRYAPGRKASFVFDEAGTLVAATAYVKKRVGHEWLEAEEEAYYEEYVQKTNGAPRDKWRTMPRVMLSKCAEARALRRAFPEELSGLYAQEEMDQAGNLYEAELTSPAVPEPPSGRQKVSAQPHAAPESNTLTFKKGEHAGKAPADCPTTHLQDALARWSEGKATVRPEMRAEVERVLEERENHIGDGMTSEEDEAPFLRTLAKTSSATALPVEKTDDAVEGEVTELSPATPETEEAAPAPDAQPETPDAQPETPKKMSNAVKKLIMAVERAGLSMAPEFRAERLAAVNAFLKTHGNDVEITSFNDLSIPLTFKVQTEIDELKLSWGLSNSAPAESEDAE